ncbi:MAG: hypothetical protein OEL89_01775, partial [Candidatus Peregrinibacteria bacterium]|nr:hypothetical protein [Candidatus Peregrinibacteria bacterium]
MNFKRTIGLVSVFILLFGITNISFAIVHDVTGIGTKSEGDRFQASDFNSIIDTITSFFQDDVDGSVGIG